MGNDTSAPGPQGGAKRHLALPAPGAGEHEVGRVGASDNENERDGAEKQQQGVARSAGKLVVDRHDADARMRVRFRIVRRQSRSDAVHVALRLSDRQAGAEPRRDAIAAHPTLQLVR